MRPNVRLGLCTTSILVSAVYGLLVVMAPGVAMAMMLGYCGLLLTIVVICHWWRK